jgi:microcystin-dependent protein
MSEVYVGQIMLFAGNFAPRNFATCAGQVLPIQQYTALFSILGTMYGGNGSTNFALPNLQGNATVCYGQGPGLSDYVQGEITGVPSVTLSSDQLPAHTHPFVAVTDNGTTPSPSNNVLAKGASGSGKSGGYTAALYSTNLAKATTSLAPQAISPAGSNFPHDNMQPYLAIEMCIALVGTFPPRG